MNRCKQSDLKAKVLPNYSMTYSVSELLTFGKNHAYGGMLGYHQILTILLKADYNMELWATSDEAVFKIRVHRIRPNKSDGYEVSVTMNDKQYNCSLIQFLSICDNKGYGVSEKLWEAEYLLAMRTKQ